MRENLAKKMLTNLPTSERDDGKKETYSMARPNHAVGTLVTTCCQRRVPTPKRTLHVHCSMFSGTVEKRRLPNSIMRTWKRGINGGAMTICRIWSWWSDLGDKSGNPDDIVDRIWKEALEHVSMPVYLPVINYVLGKVIFSNSWILYKVINSSSTN